MPLVLLLLGLLWTASASGSGPWTDAGWPLIAFGALSAALTPLTHDLERRAAMVCAVVATSVGVALVDADLTILPFVGLVPGADDLTGGLVVLAILSAVAGRDDDALAALSWPALAAAVLVQFDRVPGYGASAWLLGVAALAWALSRRTPYGAGVGVLVAGSALAVPVGDVGLAVGLDLGDVAVLVCAAAAVLVCLLPSGRVLALLVLAVYGSLMARDEAAGILVLVAGLWLLVIRVVRQRRHEACARDPAGEDGSEDKAASDPAAAGRHGLGVGARQREGQR